MYNFYIPISFIIGRIEWPFILVILVLGIAAYYKSKNKAIMYTIIIFPVIMILNFRLFVASSAFLYTIFRFNYDYYHGFGRIYPISICIALVLCFIALIIGIRWYMKNKNIVVLCLAIFFGLYGLASLLLILVDALCFHYHVGGVCIAAYVIGILAYLVGIAAMIIALVRPRPRLALRQLAAK
jgi:hypothetical protein